MEMSVIEKIVMIPLATIGAIISFILPFAILFGVPLVIIYAIYRAIKGLMTHNAELKARERDKHGRDL